MDVARAPSLARRLRAPLAALAALVVIGGGSIAAARAAGKAGAGPVLERRAVWTDRVRRGELVRTAPVQGTLVPDHVEWRSAVSAGQVARVLVRPGAAVEPDTVLLVLDNPDLELAALEAEKQAAAAESALVSVDVRTDAEARAAGLALGAASADLDDARRKARVAERLAPEGLVAGNDREDALAREAATIARAKDEKVRFESLASGRARQLAAQRAELARLREIARFARRRALALEIRAGVRGVVQELPVESGQWVPVGAVLAKIAEPGRLKADLRVAEADARDVHRGLPVRFEGMGELRGVVERVDPAVAKGAVRLEVTLLGPLPAGARADQTVSGVVEIDRVPGALFVARPTGAQERAAAAVYRIAPDGASASRVIARFGRTGAREIEIEGGLAEGDEIVTSDVPGAESAPTIRLR